MREVVRQRKYWLPYYAITEILLALDSLGVLEDLAARGSASARELAGDPRLVGACLDYLALTTPLVTREAGRYTARPELRARLLRMLLDTGAAYRPVFRDLRELLTGQKVYGEDLCRDGARLATASARLTRGAIPVIARRLAERGITTVADLGCGKGELLATLCAGGPRRGFGIDVDPGAVATARQHLGGLADVRLGDLRDPRALDHVPREGLALVSVTVIHEFLREGEEALVQLLRGLPRVPLFVVEYDAVPFEELAATQDEETLLTASFYQLLHPLSDQGDPQPAARWREIFARSGYRVTSEDRVAPRLVVFGLDP